MTASPRRQRRNTNPRASPSRRASGGTPNDPGLERGWYWTLQRAWWLIGVASALIATLGFQTLPPSRRLTEIEQVNTRQDSLIAWQTRTQSEALDTIRRQLGQLLAGQCAKERDRMARLLYECR